MNDYKNFSYYYDEAVSNVDYELWLEFLEPYLNAHSTILDLACGSGTLAILLSLKGYEVEGLDLSETIIEIAQEKAKINHLTIPFHVADMTHFNLHKTYDCITCFFDSVNFLKTDSDLQNMLETVHNHLKPNGLFIFDLFSKTMLEEYQDNTISEINPTYQMNWHTQKIDARTLKHTIRIQEGDDSFEESYFEYYHEIKSLNSEKFKLLKIVGDFNDDLSPDDERILVVLQAL